VTFEIEHFSAGARIAALFKVSSRHNPFLCKGLWRSEVLGAERRWYGTDSMSPTSPTPSIVPHDTVLPPPRPGVRYVKVVFLGLVIADDRLRYRVRKWFHWPMIVLAILVLPMIGIEFLVLRPERLSDESAQVVSSWVVVAEIVISTCFAIELAVKVAIAESRLEYLRRNWLDVVVVLLPFLRAFRILRAARVTQTSRVFRLRGVGTKFARQILTLIVGLKITDRLLERFGVVRHKGRKTPERMTRYQLMDEVKKDRKTIDAWEKWYKDEQEFLAEQQRAGLDEPRPVAEFCELTAKEIAADEELSLFDDEPPLEDEK